MWAVPGPGFVCRWVTRPARCVISTVDGCLLWPVAAGVLVEADAVVRLEGLLARALEANERLAVLVERQREEIAQLREELAVRDRELERVTAELAVLKRMLFGRSSERALWGARSRAWVADQR